MTAYEKIKAIRQNKRPTGRDYVEGIFAERVELKGDRRFGEDSAICAGIGYLKDQPVTFIAIDKGKDIQTRIANNFGCPKPEGYRKALRLMKQAEKFRRPVICFVDTSGAYPGADAEERGQGQAIAENIMEMMGLKTPVATVVIGEGGSGGALALAAADKVYMIENAVYSVISPEGCASILWKDSTKAPEAADCLHITAEDMKEYKVAEDIIPEDFDNFKAMCNNMSDVLYKDVKHLLKRTDARLTEKRYQRFRSIGIFEEQEI